MSPCEYLLSCISMRHKRSSHSSRARAIGLPFAGMTPAVARKVLSQSAFAKCFVVKYLMTPHPDSDFEDISVVEDFDPEPAAGRSMSASGGLWLSHTFEMALGL